jgi:hypothetical protein
MAYSDRGAGLASSVAKAMANKCEAATPVQHADPFPVEQEHDPITNHQSPITSH